jgi:hypothetical protein
MLCCPKIGLQKTGISSRGGHHWGGAMGMFLAGTPVYTIMLMGHWSSDVFMRYLRQHVLSLSHGIATKMLPFEEFYTVPDFVHTAADVDPRNRGNTNLATTQSFMTHTQICNEDCTRPSTLVISKYY